MIIIKDKSAQEKMITAGKLLNSVFVEMEKHIVPMVSTLELDSLIADKLLKRSLISQSKGYRGYRHVSCISINDEVVHGVPHCQKQLKEGDLVKIDVCASWKGYCADMARCFFVVRPSNAKAQQLVDGAYNALNKGIEQAVIGNTLGSICWAIGSAIESQGFGIVRDFAGHGIGAQMHEEPEILNYGSRNDGPILKAGMAFAIEPMLTLGSHDIYIMPDGWTARTTDKSLAAHVEDTVIVTENGPNIITRLS